MADGGKMDLTEAKYRNFLTKLAHDDEFRGSLEKDPVGTLEQEGISVDPADLPEKVVLPPKHELAGKIEERVEEARASKLVPIVHPMMGAKVCGERPGPEPKPKP